MAEINKKKAHIITKIVYKVVEVKKDAETKRDSARETTKILTETEERKKKKASNLFKIRPKHEEMGIEFIEELRLAHQDAVIKKKKDLMRIRFLKKIQDVADGKAKNFWTPTQKYAMPINAKQTDQVTYRQLKRNVFRNLLLKDLNKPNKDDDTVTGTEKKETEDQDNSDSESS